MKIRTLPPALLLLGACASDPTSTRIEDRTLRTPIAGGLALGATITPSTLALGDTALITVSLTNTADTAVTLHFPSGCQLHYVVEDAEGTPAPEEGGGYGCTAALTTLSLGAGATEHREFRWTHTRYTFPPHARSFQATGHYRVAPVLLAHRDAPSAQRGDAVPFEVIDTATYGARPGVAISLEPARERVRGGDTVSVFVTLQNLTSAPVSMQFTSTCQIRVRHYRTGWNAGAPPSNNPAEMCGDAITGMTLDARETKVRQVVWRALDESGAPLAADVYALVASLGMYWPPERVLAAPVRFISVTP